MSPPDNPLHLALFDLDHTLLDGDSNTLWLDFLIAGRHLPPDTAARQAVYMERYGAGELDIREYLEFHLRLLADRPLAEWLPVRNAFIAERIRPRISSEAREAVARHLAQGHRSVVITATHEFLSSAIAGLFGLPVIAPRGEIIDARLSGRILGPICFRESKVSCLEDWLKRVGLAASRIGNRHFYSDSANDLPLLEAVSHPIVVNPDARLGEIARQRGWESLTWRSR